MFADWLKGVTIWWWKAPASASHEHEEYTPVGTTQLMAMAVANIDKRLTEALGGESGPVFDEAMKLKGHAHRYDTMVNDGIWRCGICGAPKPKE